MKKNIIKISLSISIIVIFLTASISKALTLDDIYMLLNSDIINPTQASILMQNAYMFGGPIPSMEVAPRQIATEPVITCLTINSNLKRSDRDTVANGNAVTTLQKFLNKNGFLPVDPTGYFGELTTIGVKAFQAVNGIDPTGFVGSTTRAKIKNVDCDNIDIPTGGISTDPRNPPIPGKPDSLPPFMTVVAEPQTVNINDYTTLSWSANNAVGKCTITAKDIDGKVMNGTINFTGSTQVGPISKPVKYTVVCYNKYGIPGTKSVDINIMSVVTDTGQKTFIVGPKITSTIPASANRGDIISVQGTDFLPGSGVFFDGVRINNSQILTQSSTSITFRIPEYQACPTGYCPIPSQDTNIETGGKKVIQVSNMNGFSNDFIFSLPSKIITIKGSALPTVVIREALTISTSTPTQGNRGDTVTLTGTGFANDSVVLFGGFKVPTNFITSKSNTQISFTVPPFQIGCTDPDLEVCPRVPIPGSGTVVETGGDKTITVVNIDSHSTTTSVIFSLPSKTVTY